MKYKKILFLFLLSGFFLTSCGKEKNPVEELQTEVVIDVPSEPVSETEIETSAPTETPKEEPVIKKDSTLEELQSLQLENKYLNEFMNELLTLQEKHMLDVYNQLSIGDSHKKVMETLASNGLRYDEQVRMISCYDDSKNVINMGDRTGIVVFDKMNLSLLDEKNNMTSTETSKYYLDQMNKEETDENVNTNEKDSDSSLNLEEVSSEDTKENTNPNIPEGANIISTEKDGSVVIEKIEEPEREYQSLDVKNPVYHSYIAFTFNNLNVLVGKFKYFDRLEWYPKDLNEEILSGSLDGKVKGISLRLSKDSDSRTIYEKMDEIRTKIEENNIKIESLKSEYLPKFTEFFNSITEETHMKTVLNEIESKGYQIEKMNLTVLKELNNRFQRNYTEGYYVSLGIDEEKDSPDLRYNNNYITLLFNDKNMMYYKCLTTADNVEEHCKDILDINDYELKDIYSSIKKLSEEISEFESERLYFTQYIDKNIALFNSKIEFNETKDFILSEIERAGLKYEENFNNLTITSYRDEANLNISAFKDNGDPNYDECLAVFGGSKDIYLFFKDGIICGIYRTDYFDISEVVITTYSNLKTVFNGLENLDLKIESKKQELVQYTNMLDTRLNSFKSNLGYSINHKDGQIYTKSDVLNALELGGYSYEEGMNKGDGLYFIGIKRMPSDESFSLKIYFNKNEEIETIQ